MYQIQVHVTDAIEQSVQGSLIRHRTSEQGLTILEGCNCHPLQPLGPGGIKYPFNADFVNSRHSTFVCTPVILTNRGRKMI